MMSKLHVIGLGQRLPAYHFDSSLRGRRIVARRCESARSWLGNAYSTEESFEDLFDTLQPTEAMAEVVERLVHHSDLQGGCVYLVPESGAIGDATVAAVSKRISVTITGGAIETSKPAGNVQVVDALDLAIAEERFPFDSGLAEIDPARPALVTNWHGECITKMARQRIDRMLGPVAIDPTPSGSVLLEESAFPGPLRSLAGLEQIVAVLRSPDGCPWDRQQTIDSVLPLMADELEELQEAVRAGTVAEQADELGDVLLHIALIAQIAREEQRFTMADVLESISGKMVRRHPHVFGNESISDIDELMRMWDRVKAGESLRDHSTCEQGTAGE